MKMSSHCSYSLLILWSLFTCFCSVVGGFLPKATVASAEKMVAAAWTGSREVILLQKIRPSDESEEGNEDHVEDIMENEQFAAADEQEAEPIRTIGGGADMIFEMARQMLLWDETEDFMHREEPPTNTPLRTSQLLKNYQLGSETNTQEEEEAAEKGPWTVRVLPRWRPLEGVSDVNPKFRTQSPMMNSIGYSKTIWRNARKTNKPSLWRHALRTYDRMEQNAATKASDHLQQHSDQTKLKVPRTNSHHEGALVACAKLGLWKKALQIYQGVEKQQRNQGMYTKVSITDNMVLSLIRACVRRARDLENVGKTVQERRAPLDACTEILLAMEEHHGLPLVARHLNPLAAAYHKLGLIQEASTLLRMNLADRSSGPEAESGEDTFNINDVRAKDKGSYSLLVKGAVLEGSWADAVDALRTMTDAGLYPNSRNLNAWTEVSERKTKQRATRSWKKKRDESWLESV